MSAGMSVNERELTMTLPDRIEAKIVREPMSGCWLWVGATNKGYGSVSWNGKTSRAHRVTYKILRGEIPKGLEIDHLCGVTCCVNPPHMEAVTGRTNVLRGHSITAKNAAKTHCPKGHALEGNNLCEWAKTRKRRICRICLNAKFRIRDTLRRKAAKQAALDARSRAGEEGK